MEVCLRGTVVRRHLLSLSLPLLTQFYCLATTEESMYGAASVPLLTAVVEQSSVPHTEKYSGMSTLDRHSQPRNCSRLIFLDDTRPYGGGPLWRLSTVQQ